MHSIDGCLTGFDHRRKNAVFIEQIAEKVGV